MANAVKGSTKRNILLDGDADERERLFSTMVYVVVGALLSEGASYPDAEDAGQEAASKVWENRERYDPAIGGPISWAIAIGRNRWLSNLKHEASLRQRAQGKAELPRDDEGPASIVEQRDRDGVVRTALGKLPREEAMVLSLRYAEGKSWAAIAAATGTCAQTAATRGHRAKRHLREILLSANRKGGL